MYKLTVAQHALLVEALRRFEAFGIRREGKQWTIRDLTTTWTGLGTRTDYKPAVDAGLMKIYNESYAERVDCWWLLTEEGAKIVLSWHMDGFGLEPNQYTIAPSKEPPREGEFSTKKLLLVTFTATFQTEIIIDPNDDLDVLSDYLGDIDIPETPTVKYKPNTYEVQSISDNGELIEIPV